MTLYNKYRPRLFENIIGQPGIVRSLARNIAQGTTSHAYLFSGPRGTGKTSVARIFALAVNCLEPVKTTLGVDPCLECSSCLDIIDDNSLDLIEVDAASNSGVDAVRALIEKVNYASPGKKKVYIIDEVHMLSEAAFNALLKTLEEPPAHVIFILATTNPRKVPATVLSRLEQQNFNLVARSEMEKLVGDIAITEGIDLDLIPIAINRGTGSVRDTLSVLDSIKDLDAESLRLTDPSIDLVIAIGSKQIIQIFKVIAEIDGTGTDMRIVAEDTLGLLRDCFLIQMDASELVKMLDWGGRVDFAKNLGPKATVSAIERIGEAVQSMASGYNARINLEIALSRWAKTL